MTEPSSQRIVHLIERHDLNTHARLQVLFEESIHRLPNLNFKH
jgi:hypothetical protein